LRRGFNFPSRRFPFVPDFSRLCRSLLLVYIIPHQTGDLKRCAAAGGKQAGKQAGEQGGKEGGAAGCGHGMFLVVDVAGAAPSGDAA